MALISRLLQLPIFDGYITEKPSKFVTEFAVCITSKQKPTHHRTSAKFDGEKTLPDYLARKWFD